MTQAIRNGGLGLLLVLIALAGPAWAKDDGQEDLDKATQAKLAVRTLSDLSEVVRLCESAMKKGLDPEGNRFAQQLLASTLAQRGSAIAKGIFDAKTIDPNWREFRHVALSDLERAVKYDPRQFEAFYHIAQLNLLPADKEKHGALNEKRALEALDTALGPANPDGPLKAQALALRAELQKDPKKKLADLSEAVRIAAGDPAPLRARAEIYAREEKSELALADIEAALKLEPDHVATIELKSLILAKLKKFDEALKAAEQARKREPKSVAPLVRRSQIHAMQPDLEAALKDLNDALEIEPDNAAVLLFRANVYQELKNNDKALADLNRILELRPNFDMAARLRAAILAGQKKMDRAIEGLEEFVKANPEDMDTLEQLAAFYLAVHKPQKAFDMLDAVLKKDPNNVAALRGRADAHLGVGKHAEAVADYEKAYKLEKEDSGLLNNFA
jgi:tetratricopeptide (TPR) repeat protein